MYLYGASGHAKVIIDILLASKVGIEGLYDDNTAIDSLLNFPVLPSNKIQGPLIISIGNNYARKKIANSIEVEFGKAIHPSAIISSFSSIDYGTAVMQGAILQSCCKIGKHCIINTGASIDHDCSVNDYVHISPHATLCGNVTIGEGTWIGAGAVILPGIKIGSWSIIGAGTIVTKDVPDYVVAVGNKCKTIKRIHHE